uniref:Reverse transcriptase domain-containing protein n=1 Tax=Tanacetum cinerariifolium TaxID=118510 RepID=A0A699K6Q0_TANCI|nr:hypothetical protein [Tanacetum cinerariifolium]
MPKVLSRAWEKFFEIQHAQPEDTHELLRKLIEDLQIIKNSSNAIAPILPTKEPNNSLSIGDEHLSTIPETKSDEVIKSSVENLVPIPNEFEDFFDNESESDVSVCDDFMTLSNPLFDSDDDFTSSDDDRLDLEEEIRLVKNLLYDNSSLRPPEELNAEIADTIVESLFPSLIPIEDSDSQMEEIDLFLDMNDLMPPGIENDDYDSEWNIYFLEELLSNDTLPLPKNESSNFDHHDDSSFSRPPLEPPDVEVFFDFNPDTGVLTAKVVEDISKQYVLMPKVLPS